jgi:hypothetical protein
MFACIGAVAFDQRPLQSGGCVSPETGHLQQQQEALIISNPTRMPTPPPTKRQPFSIG